MIDAIDPLSACVWMVWLAAMAMFPLGILLPGCPCCSICPEEVEFDRCIRLRNLSPVTPPDAWDGVAHVHGFSVVVRRLSDINVIQACREQDSSGSCIRYGYNIRFREPNFGALAQETITNFDAVAAFLRGQQPITATFSGFLGVASSQWEITVASPTPFCGKPLCSNSNNSNAQLAAGTVPFSATIQYPKEIETYPNSSSDDGISQFTNTCVSQSQQATQTMRLTRFGGNAGPVFGTDCTYGEERRTCETYLSALSRLRRYGNWLEPPPAGGYGGVRTYASAISAHSFFCGDLLWAIENGPCKSSRKLNYNVEGEATVTLGGDDNKPWRSGYCFPTTLVQQPPYNKGKCAPLEVEFDVSEKNLEDYGGGLTGCFVPRGTYIASGGFQNCNFLLYSAPVTLTNDCGVNTLVAALVREKWCDPFIGGEYMCFPFGGGGCNVGKFLPARPAETVYYGLTPDYGYRPRALQAVGLIKNFTPNQEGTFTATPASSTVPAAGGVVTVEYCCPPSTQTYEVPRTEDRYPRTVLIEGLNLSASRGAGRTAYATQLGHGECRFNVRWLGVAFGSGDNAEYWWFSGYSPRCFYGQVETIDAPQCNWSVSLPDGEEWLQVTKVADGNDAGLIKVVVDDYPTFATIRRAKIEVLDAGGWKRTYFVRQGFY